MRSFISTLTDWWDQWRAKKITDREGMIALLREPRYQKLLGPDVSFMIQGALSVAGMQVRHVMVPRVNMVVIPVQTSPAEILEKVLESGHSRFPVIGESLDEIMGILLAKDLLAHFSEKHTTRFQMKDVMRAPIFVPESKRLDVLLREFRSSRNHMAMVVDEYSGISGLVTIEDVIEEIIGDIEDEHDSNEDTLIERYSDNHFTVRAECSIEIFNQSFQTDFPDDEFETIGGLILKRFGHLPKRGETLLIENLQFRVLRADKRRIHLLRLKRLPSVIAEDADSL